MARDFKAAAEAYQKFAHALQELEAARKLFDSAGEPLPEQLKEFFGLNRGYGRASEPSVTIFPPRRKSKPDEATDDWISIPVTEATATSLVLATLRKANAPVSAKQVIESVQELNPMLTRGSINNIGTRLGGKEIRRDDSGWALIDSSKAGLVNEGFLWGPEQIFDKQEKAAHRREAILTILKAIPGGLQTVQIVEMLRRTKWVHAPASKDLVKADMEVLERTSKVRKISNSRKWCLIPED